MTPLDEAKKAIAEAHRELDGLCVRFTRDSNASPSWTHAAIDRAVAKVIEAAAFIIDDSNIGEGEWWAAAQIRSLAQELGVEEK